MTQKNSINKNAFTLFELLLSMSLIAIIFVMSVPLYQNFLYRSEIDDAVNLYYKSLKTAQNFAENGYEDSNWGVAFSSNKVYVFSGSSFSTRDTNLDRTFDISNRINATGLTEVVFSKFYGFPNNTGAITITNVGVTKNINVNAKGQISF